MTLDRLAHALLIALAIALLHAAPVRAHDEGQAPNAPAHADFETLTGTVQVLVVDDATRGTSSRHVELRLDDGTLVALRGDGAPSLQGGSRASVTGQRSGTWLDVAAARTVAGAPSNATKANAEIEGTFAVLHADDFAHGKSAFVYQVHQASGKVNRLRLGTAPAALAPGMRLRVTGRAETDGESMTPEHITILAQTTSSREETTGVKAATSNSVLVIMANFNNTVAPAFTAAQAQQVMTSDTDSVANFFREASYGQQVMNVTVTPSWVTMSMAQPASCGDTDWQSIGRYAEAAARAFGAAYDPTAYKFVVYVFPTVPACDWTGLAYIGSPRKAWINGAESFMTQAIAHEMGHNFGLLHAASLRCGSVVIGGRCTASEYGDPFDTMGNQRAMHYNAMQKSKLAWIASTAVRTHTGGSATYTLSPIEVADAATYAVKIPTGSSVRTYWLEFRQPIGFDSPLSAFPNNGVQIRVSAPFETLCAGCDTYSDDTELLDTTPATTSFTDATLTAGRTFTDATYGVNVTVLSASASATTVRVDTGGAVPPAPTATTTTLTATPNPSQFGTDVAFTASTVGSSPSGTIQFMADGAPIAGCGAVPLSGDSGGGTATCVTSALVAGTHVILADYAGDGMNAASTSAGYTQVVTAPANSVNVALAANGGVASASSVYNDAYPVTAVIDNNRTGAPWSGGGGWNDGTPDAWPDWVQVNFNGAKTIDRVVVYTLQDNYGNPVEPTDTMTFSRYGITAFTVQGWNGSAWVTLGSVGNNDLVKRTISFSPYTTDRIRVNVTSALAGWSRITEIEAWTPGATAATNYALASNGGVASASSAYSDGYPVGAVNNGDETGASWAAGGGWNDGTRASLPDWVQVAFSGQKTIDHIVVTTLQDNYGNPVQPTDTMTFSRYGITAFDVQAWDGANWVMLASVTGNNLVRRSVSFSACTTDRIRVLVTGVVDGTWSRITEIEAWGG